MWRLSSLIAVIGLLEILISFTAWAEKKQASSSQATLRARLSLLRLDEVAYSCDDYRGSPFKWGMSEQETIAVIQRKFESTYIPKILNELEPRKQDRIRTQWDFELKRMHGSHVLFAGQSLPWDNSIIDYEYGHRNNESMLVFWERRCKRRRFLFFWSKRLYKQFYYLDSAPFSNKSFEESVEYVRSYLRMVEVPDFKGHLFQNDKGIIIWNWQLNGDYILRAYQPCGSEFALVLIQKSVNPQVELARSRNSSPHPSFGRVKNCIIDSSLDGEQDPNEDIVDEILGEPRQPSAEQRRIQERSEKQR